jgi:hypothetical protein
MHRFRLLRPPEDRDPIADWDDGVEYEIIKCPASPGHQRGGKRIGQLRITLATRAVPDLVWTWLPGLLITDEVRELFEKHHLTGFELEPAVARYQSDDAETSPPRLWEFRTTGWGGVAAEDSGVELISRTACCGHLKYSAFRDPKRLIDESQWDGSDFFMVWPLPAFHFVSERAAEIILENELTGARLLDLEDMAPSDGFTPGRLSYWMSSERACLLGEELGIS